MPYGSTATRKRTIRRKRQRNTRRKRYYQRNRSARAQAAQLSQIAKRIDNLTTRVITKRNYFNYYNEGSASIPQTVGTTLAGYGYTIFRVHPHTTQWNPCLDLPTDAQKEDDLWNLHRSQSQIRIDIGTENNTPVDFHCYIIQVKAKYRDLLYANYGSDLTGFYNPAVVTQATPDAIGFYPFNAFSSGQVFLSNVFEVKKRWKFTLGQVAYGNDQPAIRNMKDTVRHLYYTQTYGGREGTKIQRGNGAPIEEALDVSNRVVPRKDWTFCLIVSNNGINDLEYPIVKHTTLHTLSTDD